MKFVKFVVFSLGVLLILLYLCSNSNYQAQEISTDSLVRTELIQADSSITVAGWREVFTDPLLAALIEEGLTNNSDLRIAKLHIDAAKAELRHAKGALFPEVDINAEGEAKRLRSSAQKNGDDDNTVITVTP